jgi:hypothetical protein
LKTACAKHAIANGQFHKRKFSPAEIASVLDDLHEDLQTLNTKINGDVVDVEGDVEARETQRIMAAITAITKVIAAASPRLRATTGTSGSADG